MTRLFVFNLPWTADSDALMAYLTDENFAVESVQVIKEKSTGQSRGYAFVEFSNEISAKTAFQAFQDGKLHLGGRKLGANEAHPKAEYPKGAPVRPAKTQEVPRSETQGSAHRGRRGRSEFAWDEQD